ncbi:MAG: MarR family transcriptional regulator [Myxococcota bacterium]
MGARDDLEAYRRTNLARLLFESSRVLSARANDAIRAQGFPELRDSHVQVMVHLALEGSRATELAARAGMTKQAMGRLVDEVERIGLVERSPDPADGRARLVRPTREGRRFYRVARKCIDEALGQLAADVGEARVARLQRDLAHVVRALAVVMPDEE